MPRSVLIVDDEETLTWSLKKTLSRDREIYEVEVANDGKQALSLIENQSFDVIVLDIRLPGINGLDLLVKIKQQTPSTKVIIMTAYGSSAIRAKAMAMGSLFYIEKPFEIEDLRGLILKALRQEENKGFKGSITGLQLPDLIQMNCISQITTALYVEKGERQGIIYFEDGQITHAKVGGVEGEDALFTILSWSSGSFKFVGGQKTPYRSITANWEYLLVEGMRKTDELQIGLEKGDIEDDEIPPIDDQARMLVKNMSSLDVCKGIIIITTEGEELYRKGSIPKKISVPFITKFFLTTSEYLGDLTSSTTQKISFIDHNELILIYPFRIHILILYFNRSILSQETISTIERIISRYQIEVI